MSAEELDPRPYFTLTNEYPRHRKVRGLSDKAFRLHVTLIALANEERNDGNLLPIDVDMLGARPRNELVNAGLLNKTTDGYQLHDYLRHQKSAAKINELSAKRRASGSSGVPVGGKTPRWKSGRVHAAPCASPNACSGACGTSVKSPGKAPSV